MNVICVTVQDAFVCVCDTAAKVQRQVANTDMSQLFEKAVKYSNSKVGIPTTRALRMITKLPSAFNWAAEVRELISGVDDQHPLKFSSLIFYCISDIASGFVFINTIGIDLLGPLSKSTARLPFLTQCLESMPLFSLQCEFFATLLDGLDATKELLANHRPIYNTLRLSSDVTLLVGIVFTYSTGNFLLIGTIANATSNVLFFTRFALDYYKYI